MALIKQSAAYTKTFLMVGTADHITGLTGASPTLNLSKAGNFFASTNAVIAEVGNGVYKASLTSTDTSLTGDLAYHFTAASADPTDLVDEIISFDPFDAVRLGLSSLPNVASGSAGAIPTTGTGANQLSVTNGLVALNSSQTVQAGSVLDKTGYSLSQSFPSNFAALAITGGGAVTVGTNSDKTGYSLAQGFPSNFSALSITAGGLVAINSSSSVIIGAPVTVGTNNDKTGYSLAVAPPTTAAITTAVLTTQMTESYAALHTVPTLAQAIFEMRGSVAEKSVNGTSVTVLQIDGATFAEGFTLDSTSPTVIKRSA